MAYLHHTTAPALPENVCVLILQKLAPKDPVAFYHATLACGSFYRAAERHPVLWELAFLGEASDLSSSEKLQGLRSAVEEFGGFRKLLSLRVQWEREQTQLFRPRKAVRTEDVKLLFLMKDPVFDVNTLLWSRFQGPQPVANFQEERRGSKHQAHVLQYGPAGEDVPSSVLEEIERTGFKGTVEVYALHTRSNETAVLFYGSDYEKSYHIAYGFQVKIAYSRALQGVRKFVDLVLPVNSICAHPDNFLTRYSFVRELLLLAIRRYLKVGPVLIFNIEPDEEYIPTRSLRLISPEVRP